MIRAVKGTRDILPPSSAIWNKVEAAARRVFAAYNYQEIRTPILEETALFSRSVGEDTDIVSKEMYTFEDRDGSSLTLRPENTASVLRAYIEHRLDQQPGLQKLYYLGPMFRRERPQKGRYRQFYQIGAEAIGSDSPFIDAEVIEMVIAILNDLGIGDFQLLLNSVGCKECRAKFVEVLRERLKTVAPTMCSDCQRRAEVNPLRVLDCKVPEDQPIIDSLPSILDYLDEPCRDHFRRVREYLEERQIQFEIKPRLVRGLDYYTRTTFEIAVRELGDHGIHVQRIVPAHEDIRDPRERVPLGPGRGGGRHNNGPHRGIGENRGCRIQVQRPGDDGEYRLLGASGVQAPTRRVRVDPHRPVPLRAHRSGADQHHVAQPAQQVEDPLVGRAGQAAGQAVLGHGAVRAGDEVDAHPLGSGRGETGEKLVVVQGGQCGLRPDPVDGALGSARSISGGGGHQPMLWRVYTGCRKPRIASVIRAASTAAGTSCIRTIRAPFRMQNTAAALGCLYAGATVGAWYPITPATSLMEAFKGFCQNTAAANEPFCRYPCSRSRLSPTKSLFDTATRVGSPSATNSSSRRVISSVCSVFLLRSCPGSTMSRSRGIPAATARSTRSRRNAITSETTSS